MKVRMSCNPATRNGDFLTVECCIAYPMPYGYAECRNALELAAAVASYFHGLKAKPGTYVVWCGKADRSQRKFPGFDDAARRISTQLLTAEPVAGEVAS